MTAFVEITPGARRDLASISAHLATEAGVRTAALWVRRLERTALSLAEHPFRGAADPNLGVGRRRLVERPYLIVYEVPSIERVRVVRIVHGARDLPALFGSRAID